MVGVAVEVSIVVSDSVDVGVAVPTAVCVAVGVGVGLSVGLGVTVAVDELASSVAVVGVSVSSLEVLLIDPLVFSSVGTAVEESSGD